MRLTTQQIRVIKEQVSASFGSAAEVWLFGSRIDDAARGGDIDLYIETELPPEKALECEMRLYARLQRRLGERQIDILTHSIGRPLRAIDAEARRTGTRL